MDVLKLDGLIATVALALPLLALATVILLATRRRRPSPRARDSDSQDLYRVPVPASEPSPPAAAAAEPRPIARTLDDEITSAEAQGQEPALARLYLEAAGQAAAAGNMEIAAERLLRSIRLSAKHGLKEVQAEARLELGDLHRAAGDLTTACEHWQIARSLSHELKQVTRLEKTEVRMRQNGCPTDWVLNDF